MEQKEIDILRKTADRIWEIAQDLSCAGFFEASEIVKDHSVQLHDRARLELDKIGSRK